MVWDIWPYCHPSLQLARICSALLCSWYTLSLVEKRSASGAKGRDRRHQAHWDRWRYPEKLGLGSRLCRLLFPIIVSSSCIYVLETIGNKEKEGGLLSSFAPASHFPGSWDGPRHPPTHLPLPRGSAGCKFSKAFCPS